MKVVLRVLNEYDRQINPVDNGLISKKIIYELTRDYLSSNNKEYFNSLNERDRDLYIKENMMIYLKTHQDKLAKKIVKRTSYTTNLFDFEGKSKEEKARRFVLLKYYLSSLNAHLVNGTKGITEWISATVSFKALKKYYDPQKVHQVALINTDGITEKTIMVNLTSKESIAKINHILVSKVDEEDAQLYSQLCEYFPALADYFEDAVVKRTDSRFREFNYAANDAEVCFYQNISKENISNVLGALETELLMYRILDSDFLLLSSKEQRDFLRTLKKQLENLIRNGGSDTLNLVYDILYINNLNEKNIGLNYLSNEKVTDCQRKILRIASTIPIKYVRRV